MNKIKKLTIGLFAGIGMLAVINSAFGLLTSSISGIDTCNISLRSDYPSPTSSYIASIRYMSCSKSGTVSEVVIKELANKAETRILLSVKQRLQMDGTSPYPVNFFLKWTDERSLLVNVPEQYIPSQNIDEWKGVHIIYSP